MRNKPLHRSHAHPVVEKRRHAHRVQDSLRPRLGRPHEPPPPAGTAAPGTAVARGVGSGGNGGDAGAGKAERGSDVPQPGDAEILLVAVLKPVGGGGVKEREKERQQDRRQKQKRQQQARQFDCVRSCSSQKPHVCSDTQAAWLTARERGGAGAQRCSGWGTDTRQQICPMIAWKVAKGARALWKRTAPLRLSS